MSIQPEAVSDAQVFVARLHRDKIDRYERIHESMTRDHADAVRRRFFGLDIYRIDDVLVMIKHQRPGPAPEESAAIKDEQERWRLAVGECFSQFWQPAPMIFDLKSAGR